MPATPTASAGRDVLTRLVGDAETFLTDRFGRAPCHLDAADRAAFDDVLSLADVDHVLAATGLRAPAFRLVRDGVTLPRDAVTRRVRIGSESVDDLVDVAAVHREFAAGATIVLQGLHRSWPPVAALCRALEVALHHPVQANAYLTPPVAQGLHLHADPHDVFAIQTHGVKRWVVHPPDDADPWDLQLRPGEVLYLPAGTRHAAQTQDQPSLHLTVGVRAVTWRHVVRRAVDAALLDPALDTPLPAGWADEPGGLAAALADHLEAAANQLLAADLESPLTGTADAFWRGRHPELSGGLRDLLELDTIVDDTVLRRRPDGTYRVHRDGAFACLELGDRTLQLPAVTASVLERIGASTTLTPADLAELADEPSRLVLCRRLVREGALTIDRTAGA